MGTVTINTGHINDDNGMLVTQINPKPPFKFGVGIHAKEYVVGTDFTSGDDLVLEFPGITEIKFAIVSNNVGGDVAYAEAADSSGTGKKLTLSAITTNVKVFVITDV